MKCVMNSGSYIGMNRVYKAYTSMMYGYHIARVREPSDVGTWVRISAQSHELAGLHLYVGFG